MDRLEAMSALVAAVDAGSISAAARRLARPLPTVSRRIADLERLVGAQLLTRTSRGLELTGAGEAYVAACRQILDAVTEAERTAKGEFSAARGGLCITAPVVFGRQYLTPIVAGFLHNYPDIDVRLMLTDSILSLAEERVDAAIRLGELSNSAMIATKVGEVGVLLCASPTYLARRGTPDRVADLNHHDCVTFEGVSSADTWRFRTKKSETRVNVRSRVIVNTADAALDAAVAHAGIARVFSYQAAAHIKTGRLVEVLVSARGEATPVHIVRASGDAPLKVRAFVDFAAPRLKRELGKL